jgi:hypothetical protein
MILFDETEKFTETQQVTEYSVVVEESSPEVTPHRTPERVAEMNEIEPKDNPFQLAKDDFNHKSPDRF